MALLVCWFHAMAGYTGHLIRSKSSLFTLNSFPLLYMLYGVGSIQPFLLSCRLSFGTEWLVSCLFASAALHHDPFAYPAHVLALLVFVPSIYESD